MSCPVPKRTWPSPSVRDAEGLVEVEVGDVGAVVAGAAEANLGVHVGAVEVDLAGKGKNVESGDMHFGMEIIVSFSFKKATLQDRNFSSRF